MGFSVLATSQGAFAAQLGHRREQSRVPQSVGWVTAPASSVIRVLLESAGGVEAPTRNELLITASGERAVLLRVACARGKMSAR